MGFLSRFLGTDQPEPLESASPAPDAPETSAVPASAATEPAAADSFDFGALTAPPPEPPSVRVPLETDRAVTDELKPRIIDAIKTVFDPEIPVDIYELGLIYDITADQSRRVSVTMTLTSPACPSAQQLPSEVQYKVKAVEGVSDATVDVVWEPPWDKDKMSETAKLQLGLF
jgi:FeS assembly SUF system protein